MDDRPKLTHRQSEVLRAIARSISDTGTQPTIRELCDMFGIVSPNGIHCHMRALKNKGYLERKPGKNGIVFKSWRDYAY